MRHEFAQSDPARPIRNPRSLPRSCLTRLARNFLNSRAGTLPRMSRAGRMRDRAAFYAGEFAASSGYAEWPNCRKHNMDCSRDGGSLRGTAGSGTWWSGRIEMGRTSSNRPRSLMRRVRPVLEGLEAAMGPERGDRRGLAGRRGRARRRASSPATAGSSSTQRPRGRTSSSNHRPGEPEGTTVDSERCAPPAVQQDEFLHARSSATSTAAPGRRPGEHLSARTWSTTARPAA